MQVRWVVSSFLRDSWYQGRLLCEHFERSGLMGTTRIFNLLTYQPKMHRNRGRLTELNGFGHIRQGSAVRGRKMVQPFRLYLSRAGFAFLSSWYFCRLG